MSTQAKVALDKERHPERYCPEPRCLWKTAKMNRETGAWSRGGRCPIHGGSLLNTEQLQAVIELTMLGISLDNIDKKKLFPPVFEEMRDGKSLYVKFMSDAGVLDDELGTRFAATCKRLKRSWVSERKRSGSVLVNEWPLLCNYLKRQFDES